jgi:hypothetical protein
MVSNVLLKSSHKKKQYKSEAKRLREITLKDAIEKSSMLLRQCNKEPKIISHFRGTNIIFTNCTRFTSVLLLII